MKSPAPVTHCIDLVARIKGYKRILALDTYRQNLIDPDLLEEARIWYNETNNCQLLNRKNS